MNNVTRNVLFDNEGAKLIFTEDNRLEQVYFFSELPDEAKEVAMNGLIFDRKVCDYHSITIEDAYFSLIDDTSNLFNEKGILLSNGGIYI